MSYYHDEKEKKSIHMYKKLWLFAFYSQIQLKCDASQIWSDYCNFTEYYYEFYLYTYGTYK